MRKIPGDKKTLGETVKDFNKAKAASFPPDPGAPPSRLGPRDPVLEGIEKYGPIIQRLIEDFLTVTERDKFAAVALPLVWQEAQSVQDAAELAYKAADAMIAERKAVKRG